MRRRQSSTREKSPPDGEPQAPAHARRRFGQNFLIDAAACRRIVDVLGPEREDTVVEIGPGRGALTAALLARVARLHAIEIDRDLAAFLRARFPAERLDVVLRDVLAVPLESFAARGPILVAGNLPYNVSKPVAQKLVAERAVVTRATLMFQHEVALRLTADPGTKAYGPLTILCGQAYVIRRVFDLGPGAFRPAPKVTSTVTSWVRRQDDALPPELLAPLRALLGAAFAHRRQTLRKNLREALPGGDAAACALLAGVGVDPSARAETIPPETYVAMAAAWPVPRPRTV